jgi:hypothetical protein
LLQARDIYKLVHQSVFGPGHIIASAAGARRALKDELAALEVQSTKDKVQSQTEPEFEPIDPEGRLVRVNLRPALGHWGQSPCGDSPLGVAKWLAEALVESARRVKGDPEQMRRRLTAAVRWCRANLPLQAVELARIAVETRAADFPALHHSPTYRRAYRPAYRVIGNDLVGQILNPKL